MLESIPGTTLVRPVPTPPPVKTTFTVGAFRSRFTLSEKVAIKSSTDATVQVIYDDLSVSANIDLLHPELISGMDYLVSVGLLTQARRDEILTP